MNGGNYTEEATPAATMFGMERRGKTIATLGRVGVVFMGAIVATVSKPNSGHGGGKWQREDAKEHPERLRKTGTRNAGG